MPDPRLVKSDYARKALSYDAKYGIGYYTHIHTGLYNPHTYPHLFSNEHIFAHMSLDRIRFLLISGQEQLTNRLCSLMFKREPHPVHVLDCGAGHGGTSIYVAENYGLAVSALTISDVQRNIILKNADQAGFTDKINVLCTDIFKSNLGVSAYNAVMTTDSMCQMGRPNVLFPILYSALSPNGKLVISDYFSCDSADSFKSRFDKYWTSDITSSITTLHAAKEAGFRLLEYSDLTHLQIPFWKLSIAHTSLLLEKNIDDDSEKNRLLGSREFHSDMLKAFEDNRLSYVQMLLEKPEE